MVNLLLLWTIASVLVYKKGRPLLISKLSEITKREVRIKALYLNPVINLEVEGLEIPGFLKVDHIYVSPSILGLCMGKPVLNYLKVIAPQIIFEIKPQEPKQETREAGAQGLQGVSGTEQTVPQKPLYLVIKHLAVKEGKFDFIDQTVGQDGIKITVEDIDFNLDNLFLMPQSVVTNFKLNGKIPWQSGEHAGEINLGGWINLFKKDIQATLQIKDIDGISLYPYYANWVDLEGARIQKAKLQFSSDISGHDNDVVAECKLELTDMVFRPREEGEAEDKAHRIAAAVLDIFRAMGKGNIALNFTVKTKMDRPEFGFDAIHSAFEEKLAIASKARGKGGAQEIIELPANLIRGTISETTNITRSLIESTIAAGKSLGSSIVGAIRKEDKNKEDTNSTSNSTSNSTKE